MPTPRHDPTGVTDGPTAVLHVGRKDDFPAPCRYHLYRAWSGIIPARRHLARWRMDRKVWDAIKTSPDLRGDWTETSGHGNAGRAMVLLGLPVDLDELTPDPVLTLDIDCRTRS